MLTRDALVQLREGRLQNFYVLCPNDGNREGDEAYHGRIRELAKRVQAVERAAVFIPCWESDWYHFVLPNGEPMARENRAALFQAFQTPCLRIGVSPSEHS